MNFGPYPARIVDVHDGDTVHLDVDLGFGFILNAYDLAGKHVVSCRILGINAPELSTDAGKAARAFAETLLHPGNLVTVISHGWDKYGGRFDGVVTLADGTDFAAAMIAAGQAVAWDGKGKKPVPVVPAA